MPNDCNQVWDYFTFYTWLDGSDREALFCIHCLAAKLSDNLQESHGAQLMATEQLVATESKCEELRKAADEAEMVNRRLHSVFIAIYCNWV